MPGRFKPLSIPPARSLTIAWLFVLLTFVAAFAQEPLSEQQIIDALMPKGLTRSLSTSRTNTERSEEDRRLLDSMRNRTTRSLSTGERDRIAGLAKDKPSIDLEVQFDFNSAVIGPKALPSVEVLGRALSNPELRGNTFIIAGHTDGKGSGNYNQALSEQRADNVKRFLIDKYRIPPANLLAVGYGKTRLKNEANPTAAENRRVQVVNATNVQQKGR